MIDSAWAWASANGHIRTNSIHGEQEARLVIKDTFELQDETGAEIEMEGGMEIEDSCWRSIAQSYPYTS